MATVFGVLVVAGVVVVLAQSFMAQRSAASDQQLPEYLHLPGDGAFDTEVVGESYYQDALSAICGGKCAEGHEVEVTAELVAERDNRYDANAVAVIVDGRKVGHLSRPHAAAWRKSLAQRGLEDQRITCNALIVGGWVHMQDGGAVDEGHFGIRLDVLNDNV